MLLGELLWAILSGEFDNLLKSPLYFLFSISYFLFSIFSYTDHNNQLIWPRFVYISPPRSLLIVETLSTPIGREDNFLIDINNEFSNKFTEEKQKSNKLSLYIKKEFVNSKNEEKNKMKKKIIEVNRELRKELMQIRDLEELDSEMIRNISALERLFKSKQVKAKKSQIQDEE